MRNVFEKLGPYFKCGDGLIYFHEGNGRATHVMMTLDRFQRENNDSDPGHNDDYPHVHFYRTEDIFIIGEEV